MNREINIRTAAIIYSEEKSSEDLQHIKSKVIESVFIENSNSEIELEEIDEVINQYAKLKFTDTEITEIIESDKFSFVTRVDEGKNQHYVSLKPSRYTELVQLSENLLISKWISDFISTEYKGDLTPSDLEESLTKFIYELLNKNINAFTKILKTNLKVEEINVDPDKFTLTERKAINAFLNWDNNHKNKALFGLIAYSVEYSLIANNIVNASQLINCVSNKPFYLTPILFLELLG